MLGRTASRGLITASPRRRASTIGSAPAGWTATIRGTLVVNPSRRSSSNPFQIPKRFVPVPAGTTTHSGGSQPSCSAISKAVVLSPSAWYAGRSCIHVQPSSRVRAAARRVSVRTDASGHRTVAPYARIWPSFSRLTWRPALTPPEARRKITAGRPARAAAAAIAEPMFPDVMHASVRAPRACATLAATPIGRSLNEPVGFWPSTFARSLTGRLLVETRQRHEPGAAGPHVDAAGWIGDGKELGPLPEPGRAGPEPVTVQGAPERVEVVLDGQGLAQRAVLDRRSIEARQARRARRAGQERVPGAAANAHEADRERVHPFVPRQDTTRRTRGRPRPRFQTRAKVLAVPRDSRRRPLAGERAAP